MLDYATKKIRMATIISSKKTFISWGVVILCSYICSGDYFACS